MENNHIPSVPLRRRASSAFLGLQVECRWHFARFSSWTVVGIFYRMDVLHIFGVARAGYIPQLFSIRLPNPDVVCELLFQANGKALIYESSFETAVRKCSVTTLLAVDLQTVAVDTTPLPPNVEPKFGEDTVMIFHTSGSTSGSPKLVRCSYKWLDAIVAKAGHISKPCHPDRQDVIVWM